MLVRLEVDERDLGRSEDARFCRMGAWGSASGLDSEGEVDHLFWKVEVGDISCVVGDKKY